MPLAFGTEALDAIAAEHPAGTLRARAERKRLGVDHAAAGALVARASQVETAVETAIAFHHGGPDGLTIASPRAACIIIADEIVGLASRPEPDYALLGPALETLGLCDEDFDDLALEAVRGGKAGAAMAARVAELERQARVDDLTGLLNRRHWMATVRRAVADREPGSVLICDIDHFKAVNDGHGHATGDLVLTEVARHWPPRASPAASAATSSPSGSRARRGRGDEPPRRSSGPSPPRSPARTTAPTSASRSAPPARGDRHRLAVARPLARRRGALRGQARRPRPRCPLLGLELRH